MKLYTLQRNQLLPIALEQAWDFFSSPGNLPEITPEYLDFRIASDLPSSIYPGMIIQYRVKPIAYLSLDWVTEITQVREGQFFIDEQRFGPYAFWHHQHHFREVAGETEVMDLVHYRLPLGWLGRFAHFLFIKRQLNAIFDYREKVLLDKFGATARSPKTVTV